MFLIPQPDSENATASTPITALEASSDARAAFYLVDADRTCLHPVAAASGMPSDYTSAVDGFRIGTDSLACGLAVALKRPVITPDVSDEPLWKTWIHLARNSDFRGCWSFPIDTKDGEPVGAFTMYYRQPRDAKPRDLEFAEAITQAAAIIISQHREAQERRRAEERL